MRRHKIAAIYINRGTGDMVFPVMSIPPTDTMAGDDTFNAFMMYESEEEQKDQHDDWSDLFQEQQAEEQAKVAGQAVAALGTPEGNDAPYFSSETEAVVAPAFGGQLPGTATLPPRSVEPVPIIEDPPQDPSAVLAAKSKAKLPNKPLARTPWWPVDGGAVPRAGDWEGRDDEMEEVTAEEAAILDAQARAARMRKKKPRTQSTSYPVYTPTYDFPPRPLDFADDQETWPQLMPTDDYDNDPYPFHVAAGDTGDDGTGLYDPDQYNSNSNHNANTRGVGMRPPAGLEFPDPDPPRQVNIGHESRPMPAPTLGQTTYPPHIASTSREEAAAMAKNVRNQRNIRSQMYGSGGGAASYRAPLQRAEFPLGMPHNIHRWDPMALTQAVFGEGEKTAAEQADKKRIDDYQRLLSEDAGFALPSKYGAGYPTSQPTGHHSSSHSTSSRAAYGGYQEPFLPAPPSEPTGYHSSSHSTGSRAAFGAYQAPFSPTPNGGPHDDYGGFQLYGEDPFDYSTPAYSVPYRPFPETGGFDYQYQTAASQALHEVHVSNFCEATDQNRDVAEVWLARFNGDYMQAVRSFFS